MRVILLRDVPGVGRKYEIKNIADGYVKNFLLPKGLVEIATDKTVSRLESLKKAEEEERKKHEDSLYKNMGELSACASTHADRSEVVIKLKEKTNEKGHLFAGIHAGEISEALKSQTKIDIPEEFIVLEKPIREIGEFVIPVKIHGKKGEFKLIVESL